MILTIPLPITRPTRFLCPSPQLDTQTPSDDCEQFQFLERHQHQGGIVVRESAVCGGDLAQEPFL